MMRQPQIREKWLCMINIFDGASRITVQMGTFYVCELVVAFLFDKILCFVFAGDSRAKWNATWRQETRGPARQRGGQGWQCHGSSSCPDSSAGAAVAIWLWSRYRSSLSDEHGRHFSLFISMNHDDLRSKIVIHLFFMGKIWPLGSFKAKRRG